MKIPVEGRVLIKISEMLEICKMGFRDCGDGITSFGFFGRNTENTVALKGSLRGFPVAADFGYVPMCFKNLDLRSGETYYLTEHGIAGIKDFFPFDPTEHKIGMKNLDFAVSLQTDRHRFINALQKKDETDITFMDGLFIVNDIDLSYVMSRGKYSLAYYSKSTIESIIRFLDGAIGDSILIEFSGHYPLHIKASDKVFDYDIYAAPRGEEDGTDGEVQTNDTQ